jgi:hypothetical protein
MVVNMHENISVNISVNRHVNIGFNRHVKYVNKNVIMILNIPVKLCGFI